MSPMLVLSCTLGAAFCAMAGKAVKREAARAMPARESDAMRRVVMQIS
jgi:hypothetical protein